MCDEQQVLLLVAQQVVQQVAVAAEELQEELSLVEMAVAGGDYLGGLAGASGAHTASHR